MSQELMLDPPLQRSKNLAWWLYLIHAVSFFFSFGLFSFIPLIVNYVQRPDTVGSFVHSHHTWMIRSFWYYALWILVSVLLWFTIIGIPLAWLVAALAWLWKAYRLIKGFVDLNNNRAMYS